MINRIYSLIAEQTEPCRNLATEEYLTMHTQEGECILFLWQNRKTVVIGRNQNCWKECRIGKLLEDGGQIVRRLSGGGAVFHDLGNLNFTFCVRKADYDIGRQLGVILEAVRSLGLEAEKTGRNDVTVQGRKFSGNAFYESGDYCYHHGTLLIGADTKAMSEYLNVSPEKLKSRGVDSVRSRVANLREFLPGLTVEDMKEALIRAFGKVYGCGAQPLPGERLNAEKIGQLQQKFASWDWIYGKKIPFQHDFGKRFSWGDVQFQFDVNTGIVRDVNVFSDGMRQEFFAAIPEAFRGCRYDAAELAETLNRITEKKEKFQISTAKEWPEEIPGISAADEMQAEMCRDIAELLRINI